MQPQEQPQSQEEPTRSETRTYLFDSIVCEGCRLCGECRFSYTDQTNLQHYFCSMACMRFWISREGRRKFQEREWISRIAGL